jgi:hypothetical protein
VQTPPSCATGTAESELIMRHDLMHRILRSARARRDIAESNEERRRLLKILRERSIDQKDAI